MAEPDPDARARELATDSLAYDDAMGWFERLYAEAEQGAATVPWDRAEPHVLLSEWAATRPTDSTGTAVVVGCGLGRDAELIARLGYDTTAFDISTTAIRAARRRHHDSSVHYRTADLLDLPAEWEQAFDLVVESMTVQALPLPLHPAATTNIARLVAPGGTLVVVAAARVDGAYDEGPPWPLTRAEIEAFGADGLRTARIEDLRDAADPSIRRWRAEFSRAP